EKGGKVNAGDLIATVRSAGDGAQATEAAPGPASGAPAQPSDAKAAAAAAPAKSAPGAPSASAQSAAAATTTSPSAAPPAPARAAAPVSAPPQSTAPASAESPAPLRTDLPPINDPGFSRAHAGPSVRKFARELGVDLTRVTGHGFKGRITHDDVKAFVKGFMTAPGAAPGSGVAAKPSG